MDTAKRYSIKNILLTTLWVIIGAGIAVLLVAAMRKKDSGVCKSVKINIEGVSNNFFVDEKDVMNIITAIAKGNPVGRPIGTFNLKTMEASLEKSTWIKAAELFFDNNNVLQVDILEREPVARVFSTTGTTFYIDSSVMMLPLNEKFSARLPLFTSFPSDKTVLSPEDSSLLRDIRTISLAIQKDSFRMALIEQVDITPSRTFEMIPKIGNQVIIFGDASNAEEKFSKLRLFYKEVMAKSAWNKYSTINVQYSNQVVAKLRGAEDITADSLRTLQIMQVIAANALQQSADSLQQLQLLPDNDKAGSTDTSMIQQSIQRDEDTEAAFIPGKPEVLSGKPVAAAPVPVKASAPKPAAGDNKAAVAKPAIIKPVKQTISKPIEKPGPKPAARPAGQKPKAVMPKANDFK